MPEDCSPTGRVTVQHALHYTSVKPGRYVFDITPQMSLRQCNQVRFRTICGTPAYMAPEVAAGEYGREPDVYAAGVTMMQMLGVDPPAYHPRRCMLLNQRKYLLDNVNGSQNASILCKVWNTDKTARPTAAECFQALQ